MSKALLIIDNAIDLEVIERAHQEVRNSPLVLLSSNFSSQQLSSYEERGYRWFDEKISSDDAVALTQNIHQMLWHWFLDEYGQDLSEIDGCSLGAAFASSIEILLNTIVRYQSGLSKLLTSESTVYCSSRSEDIFLDVLAVLHKKIGFSLCCVETEETAHIATFGKYQQKFDPTGRKRDLSTVFRGADWRSRIVKLWLRVTQFRNTDKSIVFMPAGKLDDYFDYVREQRDAKDFQWVIPFKKMEDLIASGNKSFRCYHLSNIGSKKHAKKIFFLIDGLKKNIWRSTDSVDPGMFLSVMERYVFAYFPQAYSYYMTAREEFRRIQPVCAILSADAYEPFILSAMAARHEGVETAVIPHGLYGWGYNEYKSGKHCVFDYALAFGNVDVENYLHSGVPKEKIIISSFPYFGRFLPARKQCKDIEYRSALVLAPDLLNISPAEKIGHEYAFYESIVQLLDELGIEVKAIKARNNHHFKNIGISGDEMIVNGKRLPLLSGYKMFPDVIGDIDLIIGPPSTALIEAALLGKDYYTYQHTAYYKFTPSIMPALYDHVRVSFNMQQLKMNIQNRQIFVSGSDIPDLVFLDGIEDKQDLFDVFEKKVSSLLALKVES